MPFLPHERNISACHWRKGLKSSESHISMLHDGFSPIFTLSLPWFHAIQICHHKFVEQLPKNLRLFKKSKKGAWSLHICLRWRLPNQTWEPLTFSAIAGNKLTVHPAEASVESVRVNGRNVFSRCSMEKSLFAVPANIFIHFLFSYHVRLVKQRILNSFNLSDSDTRDRCVKSLVHIIVLFRIFIQSNYDEICDIFWHLIPMVRKGNISKEKKNNKSKFNKLKAWILKLPFSIC